MSESAPAPGESYTGVDHSEATAWIAWVLLGALMLVMLGAVHVGTGLVALARPEVLTAGRADLLLPVGLTTLAWWHIGIGAVAVVAGVGLVRGRGWARLLAVLLAGTSALVNFAFLDVHPVWSVTAIGMTAVVIYAVAAHGAEAAGAYGDS
ncbi:DUF7144 family membrane protein [Jidongwangia harbinensis]|uniref:DUF7144 family membrane protein n=1 Tax=Jidongwangia harbinensis TaxID=2878561 RepID=UPI001CDA31FE|nr:hypothetical protein [Jidongwangia harbinensis]MCA2211459.1 hypothetical protein [Jidongwangia harbinensis]